VFERITSVGNYCSQKKKRDLKVQEGTLFGPTIREKDFSDSRQGGGGKMDGGWKIISSCSAVERKNLKKAEKGRTLHENRRKVILPS